MSSNSNETLLIGIDTGGTYTDAAIIDQGRHKILATAKALTTKGDLALGVGEAMRLAVAKLAGDFSPSSIHMVSVSTTLATNAVVEGHGGAVGVLLLGFDDAMVDKTGIVNAIPGIKIIRGAGGHDHNGEAKETLNIEALKSEIILATPDVTAFAVAGAFAVRNPAHELRVRELISTLTNKPTTISSEISSALDAPRRAMTAVLNARLIARITQLVAAVRRAMDELSISSPLMIVKGDGSLANADAVAAKPIETVMSGPAASVIGARWLSGLDDFIMSDMGGTTTDIGILSGGRPRVAEQGAEVGGWRTMVRAIDVKTIGLGGDSEVKVEAGIGMGIGPQRVVPISLIGQKFPEVIVMLEAQLAESEGGSMNGRFVLLPFGAGAAADQTGLSRSEAEVLAEVTERPKTYRKIAPSSAAQRAVASLRKKGLVQYATFTPSDAAHVLGLQNNWSVEAAQLAAKLFVRFQDMKAASDERVAQFCHQVWDRTVALSARAVLDAGFGQKVAHSSLIDAVVNAEPIVGLVQISLSPKVPVVAVGGPVGVYYDAVGERLGCNIVFTPHCDVANAVGAAAGLVAHRVSVAIEGDGNGVFRVMGDNGAEIVNSGPAAIALATARARETALQRGLAAGAKQPRIEISIERHFLPNAQNDDGLLTALVTAEAVGRPNI